MIFEKSGDESKKNQFPGLFIAANPSRSQSEMATCLADH